MKKERSVDIILALAVLDSRVRTSVFSERKSLDTFTLQLFTKLVKHQNKDEGYVGIIELCQIAFLLLILIVDNN